MNATSAALVAVPAEETATVRPVAVPRATDYAAIGHLRAFVTVLVLAHHAVLAYLPYGMKPAKSLLAQPRLWGAFPILDTATWGGFGLFVGYNDIFFMALMFFLSGLFVHRGLAQKGSAGYLRGRFLRLGVPFLAVAGLVAPLAYYPAYLQTGATPGFAGFWQQWKALGNWPAGPAWFLWVLLAFDTLAVLAFARFPGWATALGRRLAGPERRPFAFFGLRVAASALAYIPWVYVVGPSSWASFGPFFFQTSRIFHYAVYFVAGIAVGAAGIERGLLASNGELSRRWFRWMNAGITLYVFALITFLMSLAPKASKVLGFLSAVGFVTGCAASCLAFLALALRFWEKRPAFGSSLRSNAFGMYLVHYPIASWLQLALLTAALPGFVKGSLAVAGTVVLSWVAAVALRKVPGVAGVV